MIVVDVNLLIYAVNQNSPDHEEAKTWLESVISGTETIGLPWIVLQAFLRLTTRAGLFQKPLKAEEAFNIVDAWLQQPSVPSFAQRIPTLRASTNSAGVTRWLTKADSLGSTPTQRKSPLL